MQGGRLTREISSLKHTKRTAELGGHSLLLTTLVAFVITVWTVSREVAQFIQRDPRSLETVVLAFQRDVRAG